MPALSARPLTACKSRCQSNIKTKERVFAMKEFLLTLLQAVIIAATPVLTAYACKLINKAAGWFSAKTNNRTAERYAYEIADIISTSVTYASQTYVDALKKGGTFNAVEQQKAFNMAYGKAESMLTEGARTFITQTYGDLNAFLTAKIEAEVNAQKRYNAVEVQR